jgi:hypothetical protein
VQYPNTRRKIEEAETHLGLMEEHAHKALLHGGNEAHAMEVFRRHLSAFLAAGMSVRQNVLPKEAKKIFRAEYPKWEGGLSTEDAALWEAMRERRNRAVHTGDLELKRGTALIPVTETRGYVHWRPSASQVAAIAAMAGGFADGGDWPKVGVLAPKFVNPDGTCSDVFSDCRKYLVLLKGLLAACEQVTPAGGCSQ